MGILNEKDLHKSKLLLLMWLAWVQLLVGCTLDGHFCVVLSSNTEFQIHSIWEPLKEQEA